MASAAGYTAAPEMTAYNVTKSGVLALSETLFSELKKSNIKVNVLCPTLVPTNIIKNGRIPEGSTIVCTLTGNGLKDPDTAIAQCTNSAVLKTIDATLDQVRDSILQSMGL